MATEAEVCETDLPMMRDILRSGFESAEMTSGRVYMVWCC
jgi:hypothetical protein